MNSPTSLKKNICEHRKPKGLPWPQPMDAKRFKPASHIDPAYCDELKHAVKNGVEILAYNVDIDLEKISINNKIPLILGD